MQTTQKTILRTSLFLLSITISHFAYASSTGITGYSGNPAAGGGNTCVSCHSGGVAPTVELTGPTTVQPGTVNSYTLTITGGQANSGGLDVSVSAGTLINTQSSTKLQNSEITHTARANAVGGAVSWTFNWQAPATGGTYTIYSSGLSTNGNGSTTGDAVTSITTPITVSAAAPQSPTAIIDAPVTAEINQTIVFDGSASYDPDGVINSYVWDFGDGNTATGAVTNNTYTAAGTYTVTLTVTDDTSRSDTTFVDITVGGLQIPNADAGGPYTGNINEPVTFDASASTHTSTIVNYIWDFGDGTPYVQSASPIVTHTYVQAGSYTVTLAAQDANNIPGIATAIVTISGPPPALDGAALYTNNCAGCHGPLATSAKLNRTAAQIQAAIDTNAGNVMGSLSGLTVDEVQAIADALVSTGGGGGGGGTLDGATLYTNNCSGCHGPLATSSKLNRTAAQIQAAIDGNAGNVMGSLSGLTAAEVQAIADALVSTGGGGGGGTLDGATLYTNNCSGCHGALANSTKKNRTAAQIQAAIDTNAGNVMGSLSGLTAAEVQAIADALVSTGGGGGGTLDGATLYTNNCSGCHGDLANSTKKNRTAAQIQSAINNNAGGVMGSLSGLTAAEVQAIADALVSTGGGGGGGGTLDGATLYTNNCSGCHGPLATSSKQNRTAAQIQSAINNNAGGVMGSLSGLTTAEVQAIADALATGGGGGTPTTGEELYNAYCLVCHGPEGRGGPYENIRGQTASSIASAINQVSLMNSLSSLTSSQIEAIAGYLSGATTSPTVTGQDLYNTYCLACHGPGGTGGPYEGITGASTSQISGALSSVNLMSSINLNSTQIRAISDYLNGNGGSTGGGGTTTPTDGATLYTNYCSGCHGPLATSSKLNRTAQQIQSAINNNTGGMGTFASILSSADVQAIADALATGGGGGTGGGTTLDGAALYTNNCSGCHGQLATSSKLNRTATQIQNAITNNAGGVMGSINLTTAEIQAIADALASTNGGGGTTSTGESLYVSMCQGCHGVNGTGGSAKAIVGASANNILSAISSVGAMSGLSLTSTQAQDISTFLSSGGGTTTEPTSGADLYALKCQACHGAGGYGGTEEAIRGASLSQIRSAMQTVSAMQPIPLTDSQAQAIANYLNGMSYNSGSEGGGGYTGGGD